MSCAIIPEQIMGLKETERKILLVNPCLPTIPKELISTPFGIAWISAVLKQNGFQVEAVDMQVEPSFERLKETLEPTPLLIGVAHTSNFSTGWAGKVTKFIQEALPDTPIVAGGVGATYEPTHALIRHNVSAVVTGEGEKTFLALAQRALEKDGDMDKFDYKNIKGLAYLEEGKIVYTTPQEPIWNLDSLPLPDRSIYKMGLYPQGAIITSRGCNHGCAFCSSADFWAKVTGKGKPRVRLRSASNVLGEITQLTDRYKINQFYFLDDIFTYDRERVIEISKGIIKLGLNVKWACLARGDQVDPEMLAYMHAAGCHQIHYGLESANNKTLRRIGKAITAEQIGTAHEWARKVGMRTRLSVILGMPGDTGKEIRETIQFLEYHRPNEVQIYALMPYPGSRWGNNPEKHGIKIVQPDPNKRIQNAYDPFSETELLPAEMIRKLSNEAIERLTRLGYTHLTGRETKLKGGHEFVVSSAFTPIQILEQYASVSSYAEILQMGPLPYDEKKSK